MDIKSILVVQANEHWRKLFHHIFDEDRFNLFLVKNVHEAINIVKNENIDLIITGLHFEESYGSDYAGIELIEAAKNYKPNTPVLILTGQPLATRGIFDRFPNVIDIYVKSRQFSAKDFQDYIYKELNISKNTIHQAEYIDEETINFYINDRWLATDFIQLFNSIRNTYTFFVITSKDILKGIMPKESIEDIWHFMEIGLFETKANPLVVNKISYASPGNISFKGLGEPIREVKNLFESIVLIVIKWKKEKAELALKQQQIKEKEIELAKKEKENDISIKKMEIDNMIDVEIKQLDVIEKRIELMIKMGYDSEELKKLKELMYQNVYSVAPLISDERLSGPELE